MAAQAPDRADELALRREQLLLRSATLRVHLAQQAQALQPPLAQIDRAVAGLHWLRANPQWLIGTGIVLIALRPRRALRWASRGWGLWRMYRLARRRLQPLLRG